MSSEDHARSKKEVLAIKNKKKLGGREHKSSEGSTSRKQHRKDDEHPNPI